MLAQDFPIGKLVQDNEGFIFQVTGRSPDSAGFVTLELTDIEDNTHRHRIPELLMDSFTILPTLVVQSDESNMRDQMDIIMDNFDFQRVETVMQALDWKWAALQEVPELREIRAFARRLMKDVIKENRDYSKTGGFEARIEEGILSLKFVVEEWDGE